MEFDRRHLNEMFGREEYNEMRYECSQRSISDAFIPLMVA